MYAPRVEHDALKRHNEPQFMRCEQCRRVRLGQDVAVQTLGARAHGEVETHKRMHRLQT